MRPALPVRRLLIAALAFTSLAACQRAQGEGSGVGTVAHPLEFAILSAENQQSMGPLWAPMLEDLHRVTGLEIRPHFASNYSQLIEAMRFGKVQIGWFSALPALEAARRAQGEVIARAANMEGKTDYESVLIAGAGSGITLDKVLACDKSLTFGLGDAKSTSGTLAPMAFLFGPKGIDPDTCFKTVRSASHQANLFSVANGVLDVATGNTVGMVFARRDNPAIAAKVHEIWTSPPLPESAIVIHKGDLDDAVVAKLRDFFNRYGQGSGPNAAREKAVMRKLTYSAFLPADNGYLLPVRQMEAGVALAEASRIHDPGKIAAAKAQVDALAGPNPPPIAPIAGS